MIEEKGLLRQMDRAYKSGGYLIVTRERGIELVWEGCWRFGLNWDKVTAKVKAKMVEHLDFLPAVGECWEARPDGAQRMDMVTALQLCGAWVPQEEMRMLETDVSFGDLVVYQNEESGTCAAVPARWLLCTGQKGVCVDLARGLCSKSEEGKSACGVCVTKHTEFATERGRRMRDMLIALERVALCGVAQRPEEEEQMELEEGIEDEA